MDIYHSGIIKLVDNLSCKVSWNFAFAKPILNNRGKIIICRPGALAPLAYSPFSPFSDYMNHPQVILQAE